MAQMASVVRKNARTIRRWCQLGFVKGARCSSGGHWKVRVVLGQKDLQLISKRAQAIGDGKEKWASEFAHRVLEKAFDAARPPSNFERKKGSRPWSEWTMRYMTRKNGPIETIYPLTGEKITILPLKKAWERVAAFEWAESVGAGHTLAPMVEKIKRLGYMPVPQECLEYKMNDDLQYALGLAGHKTLFMGFYGAARNTLQATGKCSVAAVCRKLGVSRATAYRHNAAGAVKLARREFVGVPVVDSVDASV